jgi:hypothetical protein
LQQLYRPAVTSQSAPSIIPVPRTRRNHKGPVAKTPATAAEDRQCEER